MATKLVRAGGRACVQFSCRTCGKSLTVALDDVDGTFTCRACGASLSVPPVFCLHQPCAGIYRQCRGTIEKLSAEELRQAEAEAWAGEHSLSSAPTDDAHDDYGEIRGSITTYRCRRCGHTWSFSYGVAHGYDHGTATCERVVCSVCRHTPSVMELPEPETLFNRRLRDGYPYVWLDAFTIRVNRSYRVVKMSAVVIVGLTESGEREILAAHLREGLDPDFWRETLADLTRRGVTSVRLVIADGHEGLPEAVAAALPAAALQRCRSDVVREVTSHLPAADRAQLRAALTAVFGQADQQAASRELHKVAAALEPRWPAAAAALSATQEQTLAFLAYPAAHRPRISSLDALKPLHARVLRLADRDNVFVDEAAARNDLRKVAEAVHGEWQAEGAYFSPASMKKLTR